LLYRNEKLYLDATNEKNILKFINESENPNCQMLLYNFKN